ncbi:MAG TPA: hypothetical protein VMM59_12250 [Thermohalobaculum sp.]|nr:hypothetical protein [Thermohalobaculum sp.]
MAKSMSHKALDAAFEHIASRAEFLVLCAGVPTSAAEAVTPAGEGGRMLGRAVMVPGLNNGDFAVAAGAVSGRRLVVNGRIGMAVLASGLADHLALVARRTDEVLLVTALAEPCEVIEGGTVAVCGFSSEIADPA